jgi:hypothetical protein
MSKEEIKKIKENLKNSLIDGTDKIDTIKSTLLYKNDSLEKKEGKFAYANIGYNQYTDKAKYYKFIYVPKNTEVSSKCNKPNAQECQTFIGLKLNIESLSPNNKVNEDNVKKKYFLTLVNGNTNTDYAGNYKVVGKTEWFCRNLTPVDDDVIKRYSKDELENQLANIILLWLNDKPIVEEKLNNKSHNLEKENRLPKPSTNRHIRSKGTILRSQHISNNPPPITRKSGGQNKRKRKKTKKGGKRNQKRTRKAQKRRRRTRKH